MSRSSVPLIVTLLAIATAFVAQQVTSAAPYGLSGWAVYLGAALLFAAVTRAPRRDDATERSDHDLGTQKAGHIVVRLSAALVAVGGLLGAIFYSETAQHPWISLGLWLLATAAALIAVRAWRVAPLTTPTPPWTRDEILVLAAVTLIAALTRFAWLDSIPYYVMGDEARVAAQVARYSKDDLRSFFFMGWNTWPNLGMALQGIFTPLLGVHTTHLRLSSALAGTIAVLTTYLLGRELLSRRVALIAALFFALCRPAIDFSRFAVCHAQVLMWGPLAFGLWFRALHSGKATTFFLSGFVTGLCLYSYNAGQSFPPLLFSWILFSALMRPSAIATHARGVGLLLAGFALCTAPLIYHITDHFQFQHNWVEWTFMARNRQVVNQILDVWNTRGWEAARPLFERQIFDTLLGFTAIPAGAYSIGYRGGGLLDHVSAPLFVLGFVLLLRRPWRREAILLYWLGSTAFLGSVLTDNPPATVRMVGLLPTLPLLAALPIAALLDASTSAGKPIRTLVVALIAVLFAGNAYDLWRTYFVDYANTEPDGDTDLARHVSRLPANGAARLLGAEYFLRFNDELFDINFAGRDFYNVGEPGHFLPVRAPHDVALALVFAPTQFDLVPELLRLYPDASVFDRYSHTNQLLSFRITTLTPQQIAARAGWTRTTGNGAESVADPFATSRDAGSEIHWSGRIYWPTHVPAQLHIESARATELHLGNLAAHTIAADTMWQESVQLPEGWIPITLREAAGGGRRLKLRIEYGDNVHDIDRWSLRPDAAFEGLTAVYSREGIPLLQRIDPMLDLFTQENLYEPPRFDLKPRSPFTVTWNGSLRIVEAGRYQLEVIASGPYEIMLGGELLCAANDILPEAPRKCSAERILAAGLHPLRAHFRSQGSPNSSRRLFQLRWTPPGGTSVLVPPNHLVPE